MQKGIAHVCVRVCVYVCVSDTLRMGYVYYNPIRTAKAIAASSARVR